MNLPSDTPRLPKWIFLASDAILVVAAYAVYTQASRPITGFALAVIAVLVVAGLVLGVIPFVADYARKQDEALDNRQRSLQALSVTVAASAEQIAIAATGLQGLSESAQENLAKSQDLFRQTNERLSELQKLLAGARKDSDGAADKLEAGAKAVQAAAAGLEAATAKAARDVQARSDSGIQQVLERIAEVKASLAASREDASAKLEAAAGRITAAVGELEAASARAAARADAAPEVAPVPASKIVEIKPAVASSLSPFDGAPAEAAPEAKAEAAPAAAPEPPKEEAPAAEAPAATEAPPAPEPKPAPKKRAPRKAPAPEPVAQPAPEPKPEPEPVPAEAAVPQPEPAEPPRAEVAAAPELVLETITSGPLSEVSEPAVSADGATRLLVTAYIGIGNRLFIRGEGPGLSWEKGVPLTFVSIGKWRWDTNDATAPVRFKLYKNDETECAGLGARSVAPGAQLELTAVF